MTFRYQNRHPDFRSHLEPLHLCKINVRYWLLSITENQGSSSMSKHGLKSLDTHVFCFLFKTGPHSQEKECHLSTASVHIHFSVHRHNTVVQHLTVLTQCV